MKSEVAPGVHFGFDRVTVDCDPDGTVIVRSYDDVAEMLTVWVMCPVKGGWVIQASAVPADMIESQAPLALTFH